MKKLVCFTLLMCFSMSIVPAQSDFRRVLSYSTGGFFGVDFSLVKFTGNADWRENLEQIRSISFNSINDLLIAEKLYYLPLPFKAKDCKFDLTCVKERNIKTDINDIFTAEKVALSDEQIAEAIKTYHSDSLIGLGVVLFAVKLDKSRNNDGIDISYGRFILVYFDIDTKEILFTAKCSGRPLVIHGFSEYWAHAAKQALDEVTARKLKRRNT